MSIHSEAESTYALRNYAEAMHDVQCLKGKKCKWEQERYDLAESQVAGIWLYGEEHAQWFRVASGQMNAIKHLISLILDPS